MKRKAYATIQRVLKEKGLRFQTLYPAGLRVYFNIGLVIYNDAQEVTAHLGRRGLIDAGNLIPEVELPGIRMKQSPWETADVPRRNRETRVQRIQEKWKKFRHNASTI